MDAANIEVALKNDQKDQERIESKEVHTETPRAVDSGDESSEQFDSRCAPQPPLSEFHERRGELDQVFVTELPVPNQDQEEQEIFVTEADERQVQEATTVLVQRLEDFEGIVVADGNEIRVLDETTAQSFQPLQQHQVIHEHQPRLQTTPTHPLLQSFQPLCFPNVTGISGEVLQVINPVQQTALDQATLGMRSTPFIQSADLHRLIRMFPDFHSKTLLHILSYCHGDLKRAIDHTLFARQLRVVDPGPPHAQMQPNAAVHPHHHLHPAPYRIPRGTFPTRTHSPFFVYPESAPDGYATPAASPCHASVAQTAVHSNLQPGVAPPSSSNTPLAPIPILPSFQSVFLPVFQTNRTQQPVQQDTSRLMVPDALMTDGTSALQVLKIEPHALNSTGVAERPERLSLSTKLESTMPMSVTSSHEALQTTIRSLSEEIVLENMSALGKTNSSTPQTHIIPAKTRDAGLGDSATALVVTMADEITEKECTVTSH